MTNKAWLAIDIAKQKLDVAMEWKGRKRAKVFSNDAAGWRDLVAWLKSLGINQVHAGLEATGRDGEGVALALHQAGHYVSVVNPAQIKHFIRTKQRRCANTAACSSRPSGRRRPRPCANSAIWCGPARR